MIAPDLGPRVGARVRVSGRGLGVVTLVDLSRWGQRLYLVRLDTGRRVGATLPRLTLV